MMKKLTSLLLSVVMLVSLLACGASAKRCRPRPSASRA